jgi:hypothetical protein
LAGYVARMGEKKNACRIWWENQKEMDHYEDVYVGVGDNIKMDLTQIG